MQGNRARYERLLAELRDQAAAISSLREPHRRAQSRIDAGARDELDWAALGYTIHNIYNAIEAYCLLIAKFFENELDAGTWHRDLLRRMSLDIAGVRPRLLERELAERLDDLRAFRHVFRNVYGKSLDPERVRLVQSRVEPVLDDFLSAHEAFVQKLRTILEALKE